MAWQYKLHPEAQEDYESSVSWYLTRSLTAASNFVNAIEKAFVQISKDPKRNRNEYKHYYEYIIHQ